MAGLSYTSLYGCTDVVPFFAELARSSSDDQKFTPEHFALGLVAENAPIANEADLTAAKSILDSVIQLKALRSLHLFAHNDSAFEEYLRHGISPRSPNLTSYNHSRWANYPDDNLDNAPRTPQLNLFLDWPNLKAFGFKLPDDDFMPKSSDIPLNMNAKFMVRSP
jgi:hypothetical protein